MIIEDNFILIDLYQLLIKAYLYQQHNKKKAFVWSQAFPTKIPGYAQSEILE